MTRTLTVAIIGAGPRGTSLLERLIANAAECAPDRTIAVHVIDPYPPGAVASGGPSSHRCYG